MYIYMHIYIYMYIYCLLSSRDIRMGESKNSQAMNYDLTGTDSRDCGILDPRWGELLEKSHGNENLGRKNGGVP